ncbi:MAG: TonB-dependent receptor [Bacteroidales bacterium]|jgi:TonB-linked SusC/RagA family outer membrane protein|nr:TonB-dependent receptor [Bacteroidales bacterium]
MTQYKYIKKRKLFPVSGKRFILLLGILFSSVAFTYAQNVIKGRVVDGKSSEPVIGVTIFQKGTTNGAVTDVNGDFSIKTTGELPVTVSVSFVGYTTQEIEVYDLSEPVVVPLSENLNFLEQVVVTGYTSQQRKAISGAITTINFTDDIAHLPDPDVTRLLQGKASGVHVTATSGQPGGGVSFLVRGNNSINGSVEPLYVVDGVFISTALPVTGGGGNLLSNALADLNPADIENISILKDANATAIYGSQGANGVVVITTKRGKLNTASRINVIATHGWADAPKKFEAATGQETARLFNESWTNTAADFGEDLASYLTRTKPVDWNRLYPHTKTDGAGATVPDFSRPEVESQNNYDRISDLFRVAHSQDYQVSVQGGNANSSHFVSLGYTDQEAIVRPSYFTRFSGRINYDNQIASRLKVGTSINLARSYRLVSSSDNDPGGVINSAIFPRSYLPVYDDNGGYLRHATFNNHQALIDHIDNNAVTWRTIANVYGEYAFLPSLKFRSSYSLDYTNNDQRIFVNSIISTRANNDAYATVNSNTSSIYTAEQLLTFAKTFGRKHDVSVFVGNTVKGERLHASTATGVGYSTNVVKEVSAGAVTSGTSSNSESRLVSFFGKAGYTYNSKYTLDFSFRADGSSRFGKNVRWGYFPAGGVTWNAGQEDFIKNLNFFDALKFRGSYGYSGNQNGIGSYAALGLWSANATYLGIPGTSPSSLANPDLTWETTRQTDVGVEFSLFKNRLDIGVDVYNKYTYNMLLAVPVPSRSGFSSYTQNYGEMSNKGLEISARSTNITGSDFKWTTEFNISFNKNKIEKIPQEISQGASGRNTSILRQGYAVNSFYLFRELYVDPQTGNSVYEDADGIDGLTDADRQVIGNALPKYSGGLTNNLTYKNLDFGFFFYFSKGNSIMNMKDYFLVHGGAANIGFIPRQLDRWQKPGDVTDIPRLTLYNGDPNVNGGSANNYQGIVNRRSTRFLEDASYLRLRDVSLSYSIPKDWASKVGVQRIKVGVSASNLWTLTPYKGLDPEVSAQSTNQNTAGYDWAAVPQPRTFQVILNVTL